MIQNRLSAHGLIILGSDMNTKTKIKTATDILMTVALPVLMCYSIVGETAHEELVLIDVYSNSAIDK